MFDAHALVAAPDRSEADRALDAGRHPAALLEFIGVRSGWKVAELMAGAGYTLELLARAVGPTGAVYGQNSRFLLERFVEGRWSERLARPINQRVVRVDRELDAPLPPEADGTLDAVVSNAIYHDTPWLGADRARMNAAVIRALKPGGVYAVLDSSAKVGTGLGDVQTLHRIGEQVVTGAPARARPVRAGARRCAPGHERPLRAEVPQALAPKERRVGPCLGMRTAGAQGRRACAAPCTGPRASAAPPGAP